MTPTAAMARARTTSAALTPFLAAHEGFVGRTYRDAGGVATIGYGFTMLSRVFAGYWRRTRGHALRAGDTIGREEAARVLADLLAAEYAPPVAARFADLTQHAFDAATSVVYNAGPGTLKDRWAAALAAGDVRGAAKLLSATRVTAGGRKLAGLVRRRAEEARLLEHGDYRTHAAVPAARPSEEVRAWQRQLAALGHYRGAIDGIAGPLSDAAVREFQRRSGLVVDGVVGPATRAALARQLELKGAVATTAAAGAGGAVSGGVLSPEPGSAAAPDASALADALAWICGLGLAAAFAAAALFFLWRHRGVILRRRTPA